MWSALGPGLQQLDHALRQLIERTVRGEPQVGVLRPLIRAVDAGEMRDLARTGFGIQPLGITLLALRERGVTEHLDEVEARVGVHFTSHLPMFGQRTDRRHQYDLTRVSQ